MRTYALLIADDEASFRELLQRRLGRKGYLVKAVGSGTEALEALAEEEFDAAIFDMKMPGLDGIATLRRAREIQPSLPVLILTGHGSIETAVEAIRAGAYDYLTKPCNLAELEAVLEKALERRVLEVENQGLREALRRLGDEVEIVGRSEPIRRLLELTRRVAPGAMPVLIEGESGTGKELVARAIHQRERRAAKARSSRSTAARCPRRCSRASCSATRRAPSPARCAAQAGLFELADGGTLFLDEIGEHAAGDAGQAAARAAGAASSSAVGGTETIAGRRARRRRDQPRPGDEVARRPVPRGPVLPAQRGRRSTLPPLRERPRGHPAAGRALPGPAGVGEGDDAGRHGDPHAAGVPWECARIVQRGAARCDPESRPVYRAGRPGACRASRTFRAGRRRLGSRANRAAGWFRQRER